MKEKRNIRDEEKNLIVYLLYTLELSITDYPINEYVEEYGEPGMGSIGMAANEASEYDGDLAQAEYIDSDNTPVIITLTKDKNNRLLDLDFWKLDFSKLITYPKPENIILKNISNT
ncbi:MAG: hypothetical protein SGJ10_00145 [Bacteroidota bacterium]|nr:hypothetical protein [Bacteroidota bacterium]